MTLAQIIAAFRELADDLGTPPLWSDTLVTFWANEAQQEAARRARLLVDQTTVDVCVIDVTAGTHTYAVDPRVIFIRRVKLSSQDSTLAKVDQRDLDLTGPGWESASNSRPGWWLPTGDHQIRLYPPPDADDTLTLTVVREPLADMAPAIVSPATPAVDPEIPARMQYRLVDWIMHRALMVRDKEEKYDPQGSKEHLASFESEFGKRSSAIDETWIARAHGYDEFEGLF